ncbi:MAG: hypothetical protein R3E79_30840 [Caldilineaceae bacterium]
MQQRWRTVLFGLLLAGLLVLQVVQPVLAAPATNAATTDSDDPAAYGVHCTEGVCTLRIKDAGVAVPGAVAAGASLLFTFLQDQIQLLPDEAGLQITDDVTIQTPMGRLALFNTDLVVQLAADNTVERLRGTAQVPWPSLLGETGGIERALAVADIGLEPGKYLAHLNVPLAADQSYFYVRLGAGVQTDGTGALQRETVHAVDTPVTRGQYLTLLIDPQQLELWLDGNLTIALLDEWLLLNEFLTDQTGLPFELASEAVNLHVTGLFSMDLAASYLQLDGLYTLEKQFVRNWFQTDASPLAVTGSLLINHEGVLFNGLTHSSVLPGRLFDGEMQVEAFLPLDGNLWNTYVATGSRANLPLWAVQHEGEQQFTALQLRPWVDGALATVEQRAAAVQPVFVVVKDAANDAVLYAARGYQLTQSAAGHSYAWTVETIANGAAGATAVARVGLDSAQGLAASSYGWTAGLLASGATNTADFARNAYGWTATGLNTGATAVADITVNGYRATLDLAGNTYTWTTDAANDNAATVSTLAGNSYTAQASSVTTGANTVISWVWPAVQAAAENSSSE